MEQTGLLQAISSMLNTLDEKIEKRFNRLEAIIETRLDAIETRLDNVETRLGNLEGRMDNVEHAVINLQMQQKEMQKTLEHHGVRITKLETAIDNLQKTAISHYQMIEENFVD